MGRTRSGQELIDDAYRRSDTQSAVDRHPRTDVLRYVNQGGAELYDLLVEARGRAYYRKSPATTITTLGSTTRYPLDPTFYRLISVRVAGTIGYTLMPFTPQDEPELRAPNVTVSYPSHYELQPGFIELLPVHSAGTSVVVDYVPVFPDLADSLVSTFDGINGWEEYIVYFAAACILLKDDEMETWGACKKGMADMAARIGKLAPGRDAFRAERVKDVRGGLASLLGARRRPF